MVHSKCSAVKHQVPQTCFHDLLSLSTSKCSAVKHQVPQTCFHDLLSLSTSKCSAVKHQVPQTCFHDLLSLSTAKCQCVISILSDKGSSDETLLNVCFKINVHLCMHVHYVYTLHNCMCTHAFGSFVFRSLEVTFDPVLCFHPPG